MNQLTAKEFPSITKVAFAVLSVAVLGAEGEFSHPHAGAVMLVLASAWLLADALSCRRGRRREVFNLAKHGLTPREIDFTRQLLAGKSQKEIAIDCKVEDSTVRDAMSHVYKKLGIAGSRQLFEIGATYDVV
ncbi:MAG TPA: LuxR C-terminal-related transcriptional regulator [Rectinemataceae bacterium]|nr:LuxR C-terminal-related transcriptional regulator [Rectinemataceae bacterium]